MDRLVVERFWAKVEKTETCWLWTGTINDAGYGLFWIGNRHARAHRISWELTRGPIPAGILMDHACNSKACVNPDDLRVATASQNGQNRVTANTNNKSSGVRGVTWNRRISKWQVQVMLNRKNHFGGHYAELEDARIAVEELRMKLFTHHPQKVVDMSGIHA